MMKFLLPVIFLSIAGNGHAQKDSIRKYLDAELHFTTKKDFVYAAMAVKNADHWVLYAVYPDTSILLRIFYKDAALTIKDGPFAVYNPKKVLSQRGNFENNVAGGHWQTFYPNGQLKEDGDITNNHFTGVWKTFYATGQPATQRTYVYQGSTLNGDPVHENAPGKLQRVLDDVAFEGVLDGPATTWYENGNKESDVVYRNDSLTGACSWYRKNGQPSSREVYENGKITDLQCYDSTGVLTGSTCSIMKLPVLIHPVFDGVDYIVDQLHREKHRNITGYGDVHLKFTVTPSGALTNLAITSSPDATLSTLIMDIFKKMPPWSPAVTHNRVVKYTMELVVPYYGD